ncbi:MAG: hypothetical protein WAZ94_13290 [Phycisphaerales bacterium]
MGYLSAKDVARMLAIDGKQVKPKTVTDWTQRGLKIRGSGEIVRLRYLALPRGTVFTQAHVEEFVSRLTAARRLAAVEGMMGVAEQRVDDYRCTGRRTSRPPREAPGLRLRHPEDGDTSNGPGGAKGLAGPRAKARNATDGVGSARAMEA